MPLSGSQHDDSLRAIDDWFKRRCDGLWEHHHGFTLESTDNPGWLVTIDQRIDCKPLDQLRATLHELEAEVAVDDDTVKIWCPALHNCMQAVASVLENCCVK
jgi:hypothetical protein